MESTTGEQWDALPDFDLRLAEAMRAAGLNAEQLAARVQAIGVTCNRQHVNRLREGTSRNPSARLVHAFATVCDVDLDYFFVQKVPPAVRRRLLDRIRLHGTAANEGP